MVANKRMRELVPFFVEVGSTAHESIYWGEPERAPPGALQRLLCLYYYYYYYGTYGLPQCACAEVYDVNFPYTRYAGIRVSNQPSDISIFEQL